MVVRASESTLSRAILRELLLPCDFFSLLHLPEEGEFVQRRRTRLGGALSLMFGFALVCIAIGLGYGYAVANRRLTHFLVPVNATKPYPTHLAIEVTAFGDFGGGRCTKNACGAGYMPAHAIMIGGY